MRVSRSVLPIALVPLLLTACPEDPQPPDGGARDLRVPPDGLAGPDLARGDALPSGVRLRVMAGNLTSGNGQSYDPGEGTRIFLGLRPDVALVQELNYRTNSAADLRAFVDGAFGPAFSYFRQPTGAIPNGVVSRYPIVASGVWDDPMTTDRDLVWARLDVPGDKDLWAVSVHLLTSSATNRDNQARTLSGFLKDNVPDGDYLVVGGDLNTDSRTEACLVTLAGALSDPAGPQPTDQGGNGNTNAGRAKPYDWVLPDRDLEARRVPVVIGGSAYQDGLVFDSRVYTPLAEVAPVLAGDSGAKNMQHMAVVKDFALPE